MRVTIIPQDGLVSIDGVGFDKLDLSSLDPTIHAVQWYDTEGEIEIKDARGRMVENREITSFDEFAFVIPLWENAQVERERKLQEQAAAMIPNVV
jgi:hypothetical protein